MNKLGILMMAALLALAPGYAGAEPPAASGSTPATQPQIPDVKGQPSGSVPSYTPKEKKQYLKKTAAELVAIQEKITDLKMKAGTGLQQKRRMILRSANHLQIQAIAAKNQLAAMEQAPDQNWGELKTKMDKTMDEVNQALQATMAHTN
jgi:hypothetical protein